MEKKIPVRFFVVTFLWSWGVLIPCVILVKTGIMPEVSPLYSIMQIPIAFMAIIGPAIGAFVSLHSIEGKGSVKNHLKKFLSLSSAFLDILYS
ncbi:MAG: hypothetical protein LBI04_01075 [Treponema sp.]|jgi:hypothetical protein|nr:hypothetical protein [Treponema sp.]